MARLSTHAKSEHTYIAEIISQTQRCLDDWFLETKCDAQPCSTPVSFFPEVHEERIKSCRHLTAIPPYTGSSGLTSLHNAGAALGRAMSTLAVQERHLWLNLAKMWNAQKCAFSTLISQVGLLATPLKTLHSDSSRLKKMEGCHGVGQVLPLHIQISSHQLFIAGDDRRFIRFAFKRQKLPFPVSLRLHRSRSRFFYSSHTQLYRI